jgi:hypothetical protein
MENTMLRIAGTIQVFEELQGDEKQPPDDQEQCNTTSTYNSELQRSSSRA